MYQDDPSMMPMGEMQPPSNDVFYDQQAYPPVEPEPYVEPAVVDMAPSPIDMGSAMDRLNAQLSMINIADGMKEDELRKIGNRVVDDFKIDKDSRVDWEKDYEEIKKVALLTVEKKTWAGKPVSNVKYPLVMTASIHFSSRAYPEIVKGKDVCKCAVVGRDLNGMKAAAASRVSSHMSYQLLYEMDWEQELDQLLTSLPILGVMFKKTYRCGVSEKNVSELIFPENLVVNYWCKDLDTASRVTHIIELTKNDIVERINSGVFLDVDIDNLGDPDPNSVDGGSDKNQISYNDDDAPHIFLEQHRWLDLDEDG
jgi:hypothetical protein